MPNHLLVSSGLVASSLLSSTLATAILPPAELARDIKAREEVWASSEHIDISDDLSEQWSRAVPAVEITETDEEPDSSATTINLPDDIDTEAISEKKGGGSSGGRRGGSGGRGGGTGGNNDEEEEDDDDDDDDDDATGAVSKNRVSLTSAMALFAGLLFAIAM